jgi:hypothetical protein
MMNSAIRVSREGKRGCGFRKPGGIYLVSDGPGRPCSKLPIPLEVCPCCGGGIKPSRGWTWVNGTQLAESKTCDRGECSTCPLGGPIGRCGLLWIGEKFYPTPDDWTREAATQGVSRRLAAVPRDFKVGETWVLVAHRKAIKNADDSFTAGVFHAFRPQRIEIVVSGKEPDEEIEAMVKRGLSPVVVERVGDERPLLEPTT